MDRSDQYDAVAPAYDLMTAGHDHTGWLAAVERLARRHGLRGRRLLDVACGTGKSFEPLLRRGYEVTACDGSPEMVARARARAGAAAQVSVADMRALPVFGRFDLVTCLDDAVNHLASRAELLAALRGMRANMAPAGLLAFDVNLLPAYAGAGDMVIDGAGQIVLWRGASARDTPSGGIAEILVDLLTEQADGRWSRRTMCQSHRHYPLDEVRSIARAARLRVLTVRGQQPGGVLAPAVDESRDRKALLLLARA